VDLRRHCAIAGRHRRDLREELGLSVRRLAPSLLADVLAHRLALFRREDGGRLLRCLLLSHDDSPPQPRFRALFPATCRATTVLVMPPRTLKRPITVMRRGFSAVTRSSRIWFVTCSKKCPSSRNDQM